MQEVVLCQAASNPLIFETVSRENVMTTIVVVRKNGVAVMAADSLTIFGSTKLSPEYDAAYDKIQRFGDSFFGIAGSAAHHLVLENILRREADLRFGGKIEIFDSFCKIHPLLKNEHFLNPKEEEDDPYESSQLTAVIANKSGIYAVYSMREVFEFKRFWAIGSGREFALGAMYAVYDGAASAEEIARTGVLAGTEFDNSSSMPMTIYNITLENTP
jgi:ATP-dependent protease HslVU (ClpYQ) peptidase subunit